MAAHQETGSIFETAQIHGLLVSDQFTGLEIKDTHHHFQISSDDAFIVRLLSAQPTADQFRTYADLQMKFTATDEKVTIEGISPVHRAFATRRTINQVETYHDFAGIPGIADGGEKSDRAAFTYEYVGSKTGTALFWATDSETYASPKELSEVEDSLKNLKRNTIAEMKPVLLTPIQTILVRNMYNPYEIRQVIPDFGDVHEYMADVRLCVMFDPRLQTLHGYAITNAENVVRMHPIMEYRRRGDAKNVVPVYVNVQGISRWTAIRMSEYDHSQQQPILSPRGQNEQFSLGEDLIRVFSTPEHLLKRPLKTADSQIAFAGCSFTAELPAVANAYLERRLADLHILNVTLR